MNDSLKQTNRMEAALNVAVASGDATKNLRNFAFSGKVGQREDVTPADKERAKSEYGDVKFADPKNKKYPIDTAEHVRAAWSYINKSENAAKYSSEEAATIKGRIKSAAKKLGVEIQGE